MKTPERLLEVRQMMRAVNRAWAVFAVASVIGIVPNCARAQANVTSAQLQGIVVDPTDALIPGASVSIVNEATGISKIVHTEGSGRYLFSDLQPGVYDLTVKAEGFAELKRLGIELQVGQRADIDLKLKAGNVTSTVIVTSDSPLLDQESASLNLTVTNRYITDVPLLNRDIANLAFLTPGVTQVGGHSGAQSGQAVSVDQTGINFSSNGQRNSTTEVRLDGNLTTTPETGEGGLFQVYYQPTIEIIKEFKVETSPFSAEWGSNGGTVINMVSNSGGNNLHGVLYWFGRQSATDANDYFANRAGLPIPELARNQFGFAVGGPIVKDNTFYFFDFEKVLESTQSTLTTSVPTTLQRTGDFSSTYNPDGSLDQIFEPYTWANPAQTRRVPYPDNKIPSIDPVAANIVKYYPLPNTAGDPVTELNNFTATGSASTPDYQFDIKLDHKLRENNKLLGRYSFYDQDSTSASLYHNAADNSGNFKTRVQNAVIEDSWSPTPKSVWVNLIGIDRAYATGRPQTFDPTSLGFPSLLATTNGISVFPRITATHFATLGPGGYLYTTNAHTQALADSSFFVQKGAHGLKFGTEARWDLVNYNQPPYPDGWFQFTPVSTRRRLYGADTTTGNAMASLLAGAGNPFSWGFLGIQPGTATKSRENALYVQDDWKPTRKLTINIGLRYEWSTPFTERHNHIQFFNPNEDSGLTVDGLGELKGVNDFATAGKRRLPSDLNNLAPRLGFAYEINDKMVIRAGAGIFYGVSQATNFAGTGPAYSSSSIWTPTLDGGVTQYATLQNPYPSGIQVPQAGKYGKLNMWGYASFGSFGPKFQNPDIDQYSVSIQRQLPGSMLVEVAYSGSKSTHLPFNGSDNRDVVSTTDRMNYGDDGLFAEVDNPFYPLFAGPSAIFNEPSSIYSQPQIQQINLLRPYPQFDGTFSGSYRPIATAIYSAGQIRLQKQFSHGLNFITSYTYARERDNSSAGQDSWLGNYAIIQDPNNLNGEWSVGGSDTPSRFVFGGSYLLPVGRGQAFGKNWGRLLSAIVGDWQLNSFATLQSGIPLSITMLSPDLADGAQRPNMAGKIRGLSPRSAAASRGSVFNDAAFSAPAPQVAGNTPRFESAVRADGVHNIDLSLFKVIVLGEGKRLQLRAEAFNATNTPQFDVPDSVYGDATFGEISGQANTPRQLQFGARFTF